MSEKIKGFFKKTKRFFNNEQKASKLIFSAIMVGVILLFAGNGVFAYFQREAADSDFGYGYGYGHDGSGYGYGYGYGYGANVSDYNDYGFWGVDGKATDVEVTAKTENSLTISYTTSYTAKNEIVYSTATTSLASYDPTSDWADISYEASGSYSLTLPDLTASTTYYYRVVTQDAGENVWYSTATYETATTTAAGEVTVSSSEISSTSTPDVSGYTGTVSDMFTSLGITADSFSQATLVTAVSSTVSLSAGSVTMDIPAGTVIYAATGAFTSIPAPLVDADYNSASSLTAGDTSYNPIGSVIEFGISGVSLVFSNLVTVTIPGVTETPAKVIYSVDGTIWHEISQCDSDDISATTPPPTFPGACFGYSTATDVITLKTYHFTKFAGVKAVSGGGGGGGGGTAPTISNINVAVSATTATITWATDESSISWVVYGATTAYGLEVKTTTYNTSHSIVLSNLSPATTYHYQVKSKDSSGNIDSYTDQTLTTLTEGEVEIPVIIIEKPISEMTLEELKAEIVRIIALIAKLQAELFKLKGCTITSFDKNLKQGNIGDDVKCLQIILNSSVDTKVAATGAGSPGAETTYFGPLTKAAVIKFQEKYTSEVLAPWGLTKGTGFAGTTTRTKLNALLGG